MLVEYVHCLTPAMCTSRVETLLPASSDNVLPTLRMRRLSAPPDHRLGSSHRNIDSPHHSGPNAQPLRVSERDQRTALCNSPTARLPFHHHLIPEAYHILGIPKYVSTYALLHTYTYTLHHTYSQLHTAHSTAITSMHPSMHTHPHILPCPSIHLSIPYNSLGHPCMYIRTHTHVPVSLPARAPACRTDYRLRVSTPATASLWPPPHFRPQG